MLVVVVVLALSPLAAQAEESGVIGLASDPARPHDQEWVLVKLRPGQVTGQVVGQGSRALFDRWIRVPVPARLTPMDWVTQLASRPGVEVAELDMEMELLSSPPLVSNDPVFLAGEQWHLEQVEAPSAWQVATGTGVRLAILDG